LAGFMGPDGPPIPADLPIVWAAGRGRNSSAHYGWENDAAEKKDGRWRQEYEKEEPTGRTRCERIPRHLRLRPFLSNTLHSNQMWRPAWQATTIPAFPKEEAHKQVSNCSRKGREKKPWIGALLRNGGAHGFAKREKTRSTSDSGARVEVGF